jgi:dihydroflavonol-4-reductase
LKTLVTGASGFIGKHLVKTLVKQGRDVRCLVRKTSDTQYLDDLGVELYYGDLLDKDSLKDIAKGVGIVYHVTGLIHSDGTRNLVDECHPKKIEGFVFLSSIAAVGSKQNHDVLMNEQSPCCPISPYGMSKFKAVGFLIQTFKTAGFPAIIIRTPLVYGSVEQSDIIYKDRIVNSEWSYVC